MQLVAAPPLHWVQSEWHGWHTFEPSAYVPVGQFATQLVPWRFGLLDEHVTQSVDAPPVHVAQSLWHALHPPSVSYSPSAQLEMQSLLYKMGVVSDCEHDVQLVGSPKHV